jgi:hypothetical protein
MKRSEALQLIREIMAANHPLTDHEGCPYVSEEILRTLEKSGMLPPKAPIPRSVRVGNGERVAYHNTNEWEDEDNLY